MRQQDQASSDPVPVFPVFHLARRLRFLLLANLLPILALAFLFVGQSSGILRIDMPARCAINLILLCLGLIGVICVCWFGLPLAHWLQALPSWKLRHGGGLWWLVPAVFGFPLAKTLLLVSWLVLFACLAVIGISAWQCLGAALARQTGPESRGTSAVELLQGPGIGDVIHAGGP